MGSPEVAENAVSLSPSAPSVHIFKHDGCVKVKSNSAATLGFNASRPSSEGRHQKYPYMYFENGLAGLKEGVRMD